MPMWPSPKSPAVKRVRKLHAELTNTPATGVASAPGSWVLIGEHTDYYGGLTIVSLSDVRAAAAVSPREDAKIVATIEQTTADGGTRRHTHETTLDELGALALAQQPTADSEGQPVLPDPPTGGLGQRAAGLVWMLVNRQMLSRETSGMNITVVNDIPAHAGLGASAAMDVAVALALLGENPDAKEAPLQARLADLCTQSAALFSAIPPLRARHTAALRGEQATVSVVDYADSSITQAPHPLDKTMRGFILAAPEATCPNDDGIDLIRRRQRFVAEAARAFGTDNLRLLPDAAPRVLDWLKAVHEIHGSKGQPTLSEAAAWLRFFDEETRRAQEVTRSLRSRRNSELFTQLRASQLAVEDDFGLDGAQHLVDLAMLRGATAARAASAGTALAVVAFVPSAKTENFAADLAADGIDVLALAPGEPARTE